VHVIRLKECIIPPWSPPCKRLGRERKEESFPSFSPDSFFSPPRLLVLLLAGCGKLERMF